MIEHGSQHEVEIPASVTEPVDNIAITAVDTQCQHENEEPVGSKKTSLIARLQKKVFNRKLEKPKVEKKRDHLVDKISANIIRVRTGCVNLISKTQDLIKKLPAKYLYKKKTSYDAAFVTIEKPNVKVDKDMCVASTVLDPLPTPIPAPFAEQSIPATKTNQGDTKETYIEANVLLVLLPESSQESQTDIKQQSDNVVQSQASSVESVAAAASQKRKSSCSCQIDKVATSRAKFSGNFDVLEMRDFVESHGYVTESTATASNGICFLTIEDPNKMKLDNFASSMMEVRFPNIKYEITLVIKDSRNFDSLRDCRKHHKHYLSHMERVHMRAYRKVSQ